MNRRIFVDMDGTLAKWNDVATEVLYEKGYYANLEPNYNLLNEIKRLINNGEDIYILSSFLPDSKYALIEKNEWLNRYLPEIPEEKRVFVRYNDNKNEYISNGITSTDYLIDDYTKNLIDWKNAGGTGIKYLNGINHTNKTWDGHLLRDDENISTNLEQILEYSSYTNKNFNEKYLDSYYAFYRAIDEYRNSIGKSTEQLLNSEIKMKEAKITFLKEKERLLDFYEIVEKERWLDNGDIVIHYQINCKNGKALHDGYIFIDAPSESLTKDMVTSHILKSNLNDKIDISKISPQIKSFVADILSMDTDGYLRLYGEDLTDSWNMGKYELADKMKDIERELNELGIRSLVDVYYVKDGLVSYIDIKPEIISEFDFTKENQDTKFEKKIFEYNINGKDVRCELEFNEQLGGYSVIGYTVDKQTNDPEKIQQVLSKEELAEVQGKLLNEINCMFEEQFRTNNEYEPDITDDMY